MRAIIGSYRGTSYIKRALQSLSEHARGITELIIVDDSGQPTWSEQMRWLTLQQPAVPTIRPTVIETRKAGYNRAMQQVLRLAPHDEPFLFWEEDFTLDVDTDFRLLGELLMRRPELAQIALLRGPHFPIEHEHGGLLPALEARLGADRVGLTRETVHVYEPFVQSIESLPNRGNVSTFETERNTLELVIQSGTFTCNPSVWAPFVKHLGWPRGSWSEDRMRDRLLGYGKRFAFLDGERVTHDGVRSGFGY